MLMIVTLGFMIMIVSVIVVIFAMAVIMVPIFRIFLLTPDIGFIPSRLDEYLESRIQMDNYNEEDETQKPEDGEKKELHSNDTEESDNTRSHKRKHEKKYGDENRSEVEKDHCIVELCGYPDMTYCHTGRGRERCRDSLILENDEHLRIGKTHVDKEWEDEIPRHNIGDGCEVLCPKNSQKENIEGDDRKWTEYCNDIVRFEERKKMSESVKNSLDGVMVFCPLTLAIRVHHLDQSSFSDRHNEHIEDEEKGKADQYLDKISLVSEVRKSLEELVLLLEDDYIGESNLIEKNQKQPQHPNQRRDKIQLLEWVESGDELPCREDDRFFHWVFGMGSCRNKCRGIVIPLAMYHQS